MLDENNNSGKNMKKGSGKYYKYFHRNAGDNIGIRVEIRMHLLFIRPLILSSRKTTTEEKYVKHKQKNKYHKSFQPTSNAM